NEQARCFLAVNPAISIAWVRFFQLCGRELGAQKGGQVIGTRWSAVERPFFGMRKINEGD
ncbi:MAG: hypothetical protein MJA27_31490, partial [Pseudanabaenales cyanobacterium]|nr:hypothetical protein [Pseudanabaenales cyanobacterium]